MRLLWSILMHCILCMFYYILLILLLKVPRGFHRCEALEEGYRFASTTRSWHGTLSESFGTCNSKDKMSWGPQHTSSTWVLCAHLFVWDLGLAMPWVRVVLSSVDLDTWSVTIKSSIFSSEIIHNSCINPPWLLQNLIQLVYRPAYKWSIEHPQTHHSSTINLS